MCVVRGPDDPDRIVRDVYDMWNIGRLWMTGVRIREGEFEGLCEYCKDWLPLTSEFWPGRQGIGLRKCRACLAEYHKLRARKARHDRRELIAAARRARYALMTPAQKLAKHERDAKWRAAHREHLREQRRRRYQENIELERAESLARYHYNKQHRAA